MAFEQDALIEARLQEMAPDLKGCLMDGFMAMIKPPEESRILLPWSPFSILTKDLACRLAPGRFEGATTAAVTVPIVIIARGIEYSLSLRRGPKAGGIGAGGLSGIFAKLGIDHPGGVLSLTRISNQDNPVWNRSDDSRQVIRFLAQPLASDSFQ
jgi:hypothetical protein